MESKEVIEVLDALGEKLGVAIDWSSENAMPYVQELIGKCASYELWSSVMWIVFSCALMTITILFYVKWCSYQVKEYGSVDDESVVLSLMLSVPLMVVLLGVAVGQCNDVIKCITFPERIVIETIQSLS